VLLFTEKEDRPVDTYTKKLEHQETMNAILYKMRLARYAMRGVYSA
jgi:hypothetical protein